MGTLAKALFNVYESIMGRLGVGVLPLCVITTMATVAGAVAPPPATAARTYEIYSCTRPDGSVAPADGWSASLAMATFGAVCTNGHPGSANFVPGTVGRDTMSFLVWSPPSASASRLVALRIRRSVVVSPSAGAGTFVYRLNTPSTAYRAPDVREQCHSRFYCSQIPESDVVVAGLSGGNIYLMLVCQDADCYGPTGPELSSATLVNATLTLSDEVAPTFSTLGGSLISSRPLWGVADLTYEAADIGSGIYRQKLVVDGNRLVDEVADSNGGKCHDAMPGWGTPYEFDYTIPCAARVNGRIWFDLNRVAAGPHQIEASIEDAAGNARTIYAGAIDVVSDPARRTFDAQGVVGLTNPLGDRPGAAPNGANASRDALVTAYVQRLRHGRQAGAPTRAASTYPHAPTVVARVTSAGRPVAGAVLSVLERDSGSSTWRVTRTLTTSQRGAASLRLAPGPSRQVRFAYVPDSESPTFVSGGEVTIGIRPRVTFTVAPRRLRTGQRVRFTGRVAGGTIPSSGLALSLQATGLDGRWLTFKTIRTTAAGRFRARYRFRATTGSVRYRFRIRVLRQGGYPFAEAYSRPLSVRVKG
jgi:hypothetical protein